MPRQSTPKQVWECPACGTIYESPIPVKAVLHRQKKPPKAHDKSVPLKLIEGAPAPERKAKKNG